MTPLSNVTSVRLENQETTRGDVTDYPSGNVTSSDDETSSFKNKSISVTDGQSEESANTTTSESTISATSSTITSSKGSVTEVVIQRYEEDANNGLHIIHPAVAINPGTYSLEIDYEIMLDGKAIYSASFGESGEERQVFLVMIILVNNSKESISL